MKDLLKRLANRSDVVAVYSDRVNTGRCSVGFVSYVDDHDILMRHIGTTGTYDGYSVRRIEDVFRVDVMTVYERMMRVLYRAKNQDGVGCSLEGILREGEDLVRQVLHIASDRNLVVNVTIDENGQQEPIVGFVIGSERETVEIAVLSNLGERCGTTYINGGEILRVFVDAEEDRALAMVATAQPDADT